MGAKVNTWMKTLISSHFFHKGECGKIFQVYRFHFEQCNSTYLMDEEGDMFSNIDVAVMIVTLLSPIVDWI